MQRQRSCPTRCKKLGHMRNRGSLATQVDPIQGGRNADEYGVAVVNEGEAL